jgi:hypothetical protein
MVICLVSRKREGGRYNKNENVTYFTALVYQEEFEKHLHESVVKLCLN